MYIRYSGLPWCITVYTGLPWCITVYTGSLGMYTTVGMPPCVPSLYPLVAILPGCTWTSMPPWVHLRPQPAVQRGPAQQPGSPLTALDRAVAERRVRKAGITVLPVSLSGIPNSRFTVGLVIADQAAQSPGLMRMLIMLRKQSSSLHHPFHCWTLLFLSRMVLSLGLFPMVLRVLTTRDYSQKDEKCGIFLVRVFRVSYWF